jgi:hypothetical protein
MTQENQDSVGQLRETLGGGDYASDLAAQISRLQLHQPVEARQDSISSRSSSPAVGISTFPASFSLLETESYKWLLIKLRSEVLLVSPGEKIIEVIRQDITDHIFINRGENDRVLMASSGMIFSMNWDVLVFMEEQKYPSEYSDSVERIITITGTCDDGQALTFAQYITQTWPSIAAIILKIIKNAIAIGTDYEEMRKFFNDTTK